MEQEQKKQIEKVKDLLKFYQTKGATISLTNKENTCLEIIGTIEELKIITFIGKPYVIIDIGDDSIKVFLEDIEPNSVYPSKIKIKESLQKKDISCRKGIGKSMRHAVWDRYFGEKLRGKCLCCGVQEITRDDCEMCHIIAVANGGETTIDNLKPGCKNCNRSMGTMDFDEFRRRYH